MNLLRFIKDAPFSDKEINGLLEVAEGIKSYY